MTDILIRMEMPKGCESCDLRRVDYCTQLKEFLPIQIAYSEKRRMHNCPLHELPEHGDLIDRDALPMVAQGLINADECWGLPCWIIEDAPVIIPANAEVGGERGCVIMKQSKKR